MENKFDIKDWYSDKFKEIELQKSQLKNDFNSFQKLAFDKFLLSDFPTQKNEEWKYTNINPILKEKFIPASLLDFQSVDKDFIKSKLMQIENSNLLVFYNGQLLDEYSDKCENSNYYFGSINRCDILDEKDFEIIFQKNKNITAFDYLNDSFSSDGFALVVSNNTIVDKSIQVLFINGIKDEKLFTSPKLFIKLGKSSQADVIVNFVGYSDNEYFTNLNTNILLGENSTLNFYKIQDEGERAFHIDKTEIMQNSSSTINHYNLSFGAKIYRMDLNSTLKGENSECNYNGLYLGNENQLIDNHTFVNHAVANCRSNEIYKGILDDSSRGVFNGKILVEKDAQKTNAYQSNKTILLSDKARIDTKPQLEIFADDVKCSHGATVGRLDQTALFYIISRGIPSDIAKSMLIRAFANDVIEKINIEELKEQLNHKIFQHLHRVEI